VLVIADLAPGAIVIWTDSPPSAPPAVAIKSASAKLTACLMAAVDAAVEAYGKIRGLELRFSSEDIRTMANTLAMHGAAR
jgi:hypothetical protein